MDTNIARPSQTVIGVDPGINGALCVITPTRITPLRIPTRKEQRSARVMRFVDVVALRAVLIEHVPDPAKAVCYFENVFSMPDDTPVTAFSFGATKGRTEAVFELMGIRIVPVSASVWKAKMGVTADKTSSRRRAEALLPGVEFKTADMCEAALIGIYGILNFSFRGVETV